jgi:hypothetical protein
MKILNTASLGRAAVLLAVAILVSPTLLGQPASRPIFQQNSISSAPQEDLLQQVLSDRTGYAAAIVQRWEADARALGKWDPNYSVDLQAALMALPPDRLLAAGQASSYPAMTAALAGRPTSDPFVLGDFAADMVFTPVAPCRIFDSRNIGGMFSGTVNIDMDNATSFAFQGGHAGPCGIPYGVAQAVLFNFTVVNTSSSGYLTAWRYGSGQPLASIINWFTSNEIVANSTIIPTYPGSGSDFSVYAFSPTDVVIDVMGYYRLTDLSEAMPMGSQKVNSFTAASGSQFVTSTINVVLPNGGACCVTCELDIESAVTTGTGFFATSQYNVGTATSTVDPGWGNDLPYPATRSSESKTHVWNLTAGTTYRFGCWLNATGDFVGKTIYPTVAWICR